MREKCAADIEDVGYAFDDDSCRTARWRRCSIASSANLAERTFAHKLDNFVLSGHIPFEFAAALSAHSVPVRARVKARELWSGSSASGLPSFLLVNNSNARHSI